MHSTSIYRLKQLELVAAKVVRINVIVFSKTVEMFFVKTLIVLPILYCWIKKLTGLKLTKDLFI